MQKTKKIKIPKTLSRMISIDRAALDEEKRTLDLAFSSELPVERWFGNEILDHSTGAMITERLEASGPLLMDHDSRDQIGVIESVSLGSDKVARAKVRFSQSARGQEIFQDVQDGIRGNVSVGYRIHDMVLESQKENEDTYRAISWEPYEISIVSIPADASVGVGRADQYLNETIEIEVKQMTEPNKNAVASEPTIVQPNVEQITNDVRASEIGRIKDLEIMGEKFAVYGGRDVARECIREGKTVDDFKTVVLERLPAETIKSQSSEYTPELSDQEQKDFSIARALNAATTGDWSGAGFEREISNDIAKKLKRSTEGIFIPTNLKQSFGQRAPLVAGTDNLGGYSVATEIPSLIEMLRNRMMVRKMGARVLSGLEGDLAFPRQASAATLSWVAENPGSDLADSNATLGQVAMTPKTAQATTAYSRQLLAQSTLDIEAFIRDDLSAINALGVDLAAINGTGSGNQPTGILNTSGIGSVVGGTNGLAPAWSHIVGLETEVATDNADIGSLGYLTNAKVRGKLKETEKASSTGQFVWGDGGEQAGFGMLNGYRAGASNQVPSDLTKGTSTGVASAIIFGNWADLMIGEWGVMELLVDPYAKKKQGLVEVTSFMMIDIAVRHPESFAAMKDALTA